MAQPGASLGGSMRSVSLKTIMDGVAERLHAEFGQLLDKLPSQADVDRCAQNAGCPGCPQAPLQSAPPSPCDLAPLSC